MVILKMMKMMKRRKTMKMTIDVVTTRNMEDDVDDADVVRDSGNLLFLLLQIVAKY